jgi:murein DD-endopeptidase MepM/ murein hydrolase activator NlpD
MTLKNYLKLLAFAALLVLGLGLKFLLPDEPPEKFLARMNALHGGPCPVAPSPSGPRAEQWRMRYGVDLVSPKGTRVSAASDGVVIFLGTCGSYGNAVILSHAGDAFTLYAHLSEPKDGLHRGEAVREGEILGEVGPPDGIKASHLHFEVWDEKAVASQSRSETSRAQPAARASAQGKGGN